MRIVYFICALLLTVCSYAQTKIDMSENEYLVENREYILIDEGYLPVVKSWILYDPNLPEERIVLGIKNWAGKYAEQYNYFLHYYMENGKKQTQVVVVAKMEFYSVHNKIIIVGPGELVEYTDFNLKTTVYNLEEKE